MAKFFRFPFAVTGDQTTIPDDTQPDGSVSYEEGYGEDYSLNLATDPDARPIPRSAMNGLFYQITNALRQYQTAGAPEFITAADNDGSAFSYEKNAIVKYSDGEYYQSLIVSNTQLPTNAAAWVKVSGLIPNARLSNMAANTVKVNATAGAAAPSDLAMAASTILARLASGNIVAASVAQIQSLLNLGSAAYTASTDYATAAQGAKADSALQPSVTIIEPSSRALILSDANNLIVTTGTGDTTYTVPPASSVAFPNATRVQFINSRSSGNMIIARGSGVQLWDASIPDNADITVAPRGVLTIVKRSGDIWYTQGV